MAAAVFWGTLAVVAWVYVGYPLVLWLVAALRGRRSGARRSSPGSM